MGEWPDPGPVDLQECNGRTCYAQGPSISWNDDDTSTIFLSDSMPGAGTYECRYEVTSTISAEGGCATIVPKYPDATVVALSRFRRLSPCHIQSSWIVSSTYDRTQYGYPYVRLNWDSDWEQNYTVGWYNFPEGVCGGAQNVVEFHTFLCFYGGYCHLDTIQANAFNNCYAANGYNFSDPKTFCSICDYTNCVP
jgi:hypothetical protein